MAKPEPVAYRYTYDLFIKSVALALPGSVKIFVVLKRGPKKIETKSRLIIDKQNTVAKFNETFTFSVTLYKGQKNDAFQEKKAKIGVYAISPSNKVKVIGECLIDLAPFATEAKAASKIYKLQNCIDKNATIEVEAKATLVEKVAENPISGQGHESDEAGESESTETGSKKSIGKEPVVQKMKSFMAKPEPRSEPRKLHESPKKELSSPNRLEDEEEKSGLEGSKPGGLQTKLQKMLEEKDSVVKQKQEDENLWKAKLREALKEKEEWLAKCEKLQKEVETVKEEREEAKENAKTLREQVENLENENTKLLQANEELEREKENQNEKDVAELEDEIRLYKEKVAQLMKQKNEQHAKYSQVTAEVAKANGQAEQYRKDNEQLTSKVKSLEAECSKHGIERDNLNKTIDSLKAKLQEALSNLDSKSAEKNAVLADYKGQTEGMIADLKKQLKEKDEAIRIKEQQANEALLELERIQKSTESSETSMKNELNRLKQKYELSKKEVNEISDTFQKTKTEWEMKELQLQSTVNNLTLENGFCKKEKESMEASLAEQKKLNKELKEKLKALSQEQNSRHALDMGNNTEKEQLENELEKLKAEISERDSTIIELELNVQRLESEVTKQKKQLADTLTSHEDSGALLAQIKTLHTELLETREKYDTQVSKMEEERAELVKRVELLEGEKEKLEKAIGDENSRLKIEVIQLKEMLGENEEQMKGFEEQLAAPRKTEHSVDNSELKDLLNKVKEDNSRLKEDLNDKAGEIKELLAELDNLKDREAERQKLTEKVAERTDQIKHMKSRMEVLEVDLVRTKQDLGEAINVVNEFELKNINLREQLEKALVMKAQAEQAKKGRKK